ncbi:MAG: choice-of-anchor L domain-containing protein [Flavobacteriaceae bacterium]
MCFFNSRSRNQQSLSKHRFNSGTNIPVNTNTIHDEIVGFCAAENDAYFDGYSMGDTNYNGRTTVLTATANIQLNVQYHIKLVIADQTDENYDSAVFIQGNSFNPTVDLYPDISTCANDYTIDGDIQNPLATYAWYRNGVLLPTELNPTLNVTQSGTYRVEISIPLNSMNCVIEDEIVVTLNSVQNANQLSDYELCDDTSGDGIEIFDLTTKDAEAEAAVSPIKLQYYVSLYIS